MAERLTNEELLRTAHGFEQEPYLEALSSELAATRDLYLAAPPSVASRLGVEVHPVGQSTLFVASGLAQLFFNRVELAASGAELSLDELTQSLRLFADRGVDKFVLQVDAPACGEHTQQLMAARGLVPFRRPWVKLVRGTTPLPSVSSEFEITEATASDADVVASMMVQGFALPEQATDLYRSIVGRPGWRAYLALCQTQPAAAGLAFIDGSRCYLAGGVTLPAYRGRKAQRALMHRRIVDATAAGASTITTETGLPLPGEENPSYRNMLHLGFRAVGTRDNYAPSGTRW